MNWAGIVLRVIPMIIGLMKIAEQAFDDIPESGAQKKQMVIEAIQAMVQGLSGVVFSQELWGKIIMVVNPMIDLASAFLFPKATK